MTAPLTRSWPLPSIEQKSQSTYDYHLYSLGVRSAWPLPGVTLDGLEVPDVELIAGADRDVDPMAAAAARSPSGSAFQCSPLPGGAVYLSWPGLFDFVVSPDGRRVLGRPLAGSSVEAFQAYLLSQVLSFSLLKRGIEPIHATVVVVNSYAVGFLGDSGVGKSSLAASFLQSGHELLTDDLLVLRGDGEDVLAYPGLSRVKLFPEVAGLLLGEAAGTPMNDRTSKRIVPLEPNRFHRSRVPLGALYVLRPSPTQRDEIRLRTLSEHRAFIELTKNTFNPLVTDRDRLRGQFATAAQVSNRIHIGELFFPRSLSALRDARDAILADLSNRWT
jgi:hypothetical protein